MNRYEVKFHDGLTKTIEADGWAVRNGSLQFLRKGEYFSVKTCYGVAPGLWVDVLTVEEDIGASMLEDLARIRRDNADFSHD